jgi:hypothetical protein
MKDLFAGRRERQNSYGEQKLVCGAGARFT